MKILVLSSVYPRNNMEKGESCTKVVHEFAKEWNSLGHDVRVVHCNTRYPIVLHCLPRRIRTLIKNQTGVEIGPVNSIKEDEYNYEGVSVYRISFLKLIPHGCEGKHAIDYLFRKIRCYLENGGFVPDVIVAHWTSPQAPLLVRLKELYGARTSIVMHGTGYITNPKYHIEKYLCNIDKIGCRSLTEARRTQELLNIKDLPFICYSGIPNHYCEECFHGEKFEDTKVFTIACVSELIKRKNIDVLIDSVVRIREKGINVRLDIIGEGFERENLSALVENYNASKYVNFHGRKPRDQVMQMLRHAQCFALVSKDEIFGLVYLEAMISSCITIGSKFEGIDGIIVNSENGFLSPAGDAKALTNTLLKIATMSPEDKLIMAKKGYNTSKSFSNSKMAIDYLNKVLK